MDWQDHREISPNAFRRGLKELGVSQSGWARYIGQSDRTIRRMVKGQREVPVLMSLHLGCLIENGIKPRIPKRQNG